MTTAAADSGPRGLLQQGYSYSAQELRQLEWGLRFTPALCMALAIVGLVTRQPWIHFGLALMGIGSFWFPSKHPFDLFYNHVLRPLWGGVRLPPNPLPRRIACFVGGSMNLGIGIAFLLGAPVVAWVLGAILIPLQILVVTTHFCLASFLWERLLQVRGEWVPLLAVDEARRLLDEGALLYDVRSPALFQQQHIPGAINLSVGDLERNAGELENETVIVYCQRGILSQIAARKLRRAGLEKVYNLGSLSRWFV
jgi:rhodanese-related sulfurtransferase